MKLVIDALTVAVKIAGPFLLVGLLIGMVVSIVQAATQIQEMTLQFIPKIIAMVAVLVIAGPWMLSEITSYTETLFRSIPTVINGR